MCPLFSGCLYVDDIFILDTSTTLDLQLNVLIIEQKEVDLPSYNLAIIDLKILIARSKCTPFSG